MSLYTSGRETERERDVRRRRSDTERRSCWRSSRDKRRGQQRERERRRLYEYSVYVYVYACLAIEVLALSVSYCGVVCDTNRRGEEREIQRKRERGIATLRVDG